MNPITEGLIFLTQSIFDIYIFMMLLRVILQWVHADFRNPLVQFISRLTNPPLIFVRKLLPFYRGIDLAAVAVLVLLTLLKFILLILFSTGSFPHLGGLVVLAFAELLQEMISIFLWSIFIFVILSWFAPLMNAALIQVLFQLTEPLLRPARRLIPNVAGLDFSPVIALIFLKLIQIVITQPLLRMAFMLASRQ